jgi:hypothetical protein
MTHLSAWPPRDRADELIKDFEIPDLAAPLRFGTSATAVRFQPSEFPQRDRVARLDCEGILTAPTQMVRPYKNVSPMICKSLTLLRGMIGPTR